MGASVIEKIIRKYIGNIGNTPSTNKNIVDLAEVLYTNPNIENNKGALLFTIEYYIGNPHNRKDLIEVFDKLANEILQYKLR